MSGPFKIFLFGICGILAIVLGMFQLRNRPQTIQIPVQLLSQVPQALPLAMTNDHLKGDASGDEMNYSELKMDPLEDKIKAWLIETNSEIRILIVQDMMGLVTSSNAMELVKRLPPELLETPVGIKGLELWSASDHAAAANWLALQSDINEAEVAAVVNDWKSKDQAEFQNFCDELSDGEFKQMALQTASSDAVNRDPVSAISWAMQMNPGETQTSLLQASVEQWVSRDPKAALNWLDQVADPNLKEHLFASAAQAYAAVDPVQAIDWVNQYVTSQDVLDQSVAGIAQSWGSQDPSAAGDWLASFPDGIDRDIGMEKLLILWKSNDPSAAQNWIEQLPDGEFKTEATGMFAKVNNGNL